MSSINDPALHADPTPGTDPPVLITSGRTAWFPPSDGSTSTGSSYPDEDSRRWRNAAGQLPGRDRGNVGICLSGGGVRSAAIALGALQQLRTESLGPHSASEPKTVLGEARYLVSVSGGGSTRRIPAGAPRAPRHGVN
jgi:hypothetical protein